MVKPPYHPLEPVRKSPKSTHYQAEPCWEYNLAAFGFEDLLDHSGGNSDWVEEEGAEAGSFGRGVDQGSAGPVEMDGTGGFVRLGLF